MPVRELFTEVVNVEVGGAWVQVPALGLEIRESTKSRIMEFSFRVVKTKEVADSTWAALRLNTRLQVIQQVGTRSDSFIGYITRRPRSLTGTVPTLQITGHCETKLATHIRFIDAWPSQTAKTASQIFLDAWQRYGPAGLDLTGIQVNNTKIGPITNSLDTLFEFSEEVAQRTGWAWRIRNGRVEYWNPDTVVFNESLSEGDNIVADSLQIDEELPQVANVVYVPARVRITEFPDAQPSKAGVPQYHLQYQPLLRQFEAGGQTVYLDEPPRVYLAGVLQAVAEDGSAQAEGAQAVYNVENRFVRFTPGNEPAADGLEVRVVYTAELPVIVCRRSTESIALFGEIHERVVRSPRPTREEAEQIADAFLRERAFPIRPVQLETTTFGLRPGMFVQVDLPSEGIQQLMPVLEVTRRSRPGNLDITVALDQLPVSDDDLVFDLWRRINRLEAAETARQQRIEQYEAWDETWTWQELFTLTRHPCTYPTAEGWYYLQPHQIVQAATDDIFPSEELYPC